MSKKGKGDVPQEDIMEPQTHEIHIQEIVLEDDHLVEKDLLVDEISDDAPLDEEEDGFGLDHAMDPYEEYR